MEEFCKDESKYNIIFDYKNSVDNYSLKYHPELIDHIRKITDLIIETKPEIPEEEYTHEVSIGTSQKLALEFLETINVSLNDILKNNITSLDIKFKEFDKLKDDEIKRWC